MKVAIIGSGGREHALALKISQSDSLSKLFTIPGNPGTKSLGENISLNISDHDALLKFCKDEKIDLVVVGPEQPLVDGLADKLRANKINVFGPNQKSAMIEGDKVFSKFLMKKYNIPSADFEVFTKAEYKETINYLKKSDFPLVIKASGLAAGKGVLICEDMQAAENAINDCFNKSIFGSAGDSVVIEEFMVGQEASIFAVTDGNGYVLLPSAQDHKRIYDGDKGKNTGGMGAYAPAPIVTKDIIKEIENKIIIPTLNAISNEVGVYNGCLYCGLMLTNKGVRVVEFNCRFGDPEIQAVLPLVEGDFLKLLYSAALGNIDKAVVSYSGGSAICVVAASGGYPETYEKGFEISGLDAPFDNNVIVYHAGTKEIDGKIVTNGGRVLGITGVLKKNDLSSCKTITYGALEKIKFNNIHYRKDIADKAIKN
ncbi:phosphoribosylamine--glycine ligase [Bacteroidota bacterium]